MPAIKPLSSHIANQIAAGEVVERPAAVIKEVLENALDANAQSIQIDIEQGGLSCIRVRDDGDGIPQEELPLAIAPHATSKISQIDDLALITSLGFRGEALASISSVSKFSIKSKTVAQSVAAELSCQGNAELQITPTAHPQGTTIEARELFFNVPVRRKFLKSAKTEFAHIESVVRKIALSRLDIGLTLSHNKKTVIKVKPAFDVEQIQNRLRQILGKPFIDNSIFFDESDGEFRLSGWFTSTSYLRSQNDWQYVFLNGRMIKDKLLMHAIRQAYEPYLYPGRSPCFVLYFELPTDAVDVNVHPTKHEVRFHDSRRVHDFWCSILDKQLSGSLTSDDEVSDEPQESLPDYKTETSSVAEKNHVEAAIYQTSVSSKPIIALSENMGLTLHNGKSYIFHISATYQQWLKDRIVKERKKNIPLAPRQVLVPLTFSLAADIIKTFPFSELEAFGFDITRLSESSICVRSFPVITPHIDLRGFISALTTDNVEVIECIVQNQLLDHSLLSDEEQMALIKFMLTSNEHQRQLSDEQWQAVLYE